MDAIVKNFPGAGAKPDVAEARPSQAEAEEAVRVLLRWAGENPAREGLLDTPKRVAKAYRELFAGYELNVQDVLGTTFEEVGGYDDVVLVRDIPFFSHCEHHMVPIVGKAHVAYLPAGRVLGLSKIARVVEIRPPPADAGKHDGADRKIDRRNAETAWRGRHDRRRTYVHVHARRKQARVHDADHQLHRHVQERPGRAGALHDHGAEPLNIGPETVAPVS